MKNNERSCFPVSADAGTLNQAIERTLKKRVSF